MPDLVSETEVEATVSVTVSVPVCVRDDDPDCLIVALVGVLLPLVLVEAVTPVVIVESVVTVFPVGASVSEDKVSPTDNVLSVDVLGDETGTGDSVVLDPAAVVSTVPLGVPEGDVEVVSSPSDEVSVDEKS